MSDACILGALQFGQTESRKNVVSPGFAFDKTRTLMYYEKHELDSFEWNAILTVFSIDIYVGISVTVTLILLCMALNTTKKRDLLYTFLFGMIASFKALLGQSFDEKPFEKRSKFKWTRSLQFFLLSIFGALTFWSYSGVLISALAFPLTSHPIQSLDDLKNVQSNFKLVVNKGGFRNNIVNEWSKKSTRNFELAEKFIIIHSKSNGNYLRQDYGSIWPGFMANAEFFLLQLQKGKIHISFLHLYGNFYSI